MVTFLVHHGIKGQKWGVKNGPPYPLDYDDHSENEKDSSTMYGVSSYLKKLNNKKVLKAMAIVGGAAAAGYLAYKVLSDESGGVYLGSVAIGGVTEGDNAAFLKQQERYADYVDNMRYDPDTFEFSLKKEQKWDSKKMEYMSKLEDEFNSLYGDYENNPYFESIESIPKMKKPDLSLESVVENMSKINNEFGATEDGRSMNCVMCTTAMAMRMKGYDVGADVTLLGLNELSIEKTFDHVEIKKPFAKDSSELIKTLKDEGEGAYGNLIVELNNCAGHSMFWFINDGKLRISDCQTGALYFEELSGNDYDGDTPEDMYFLGLDCVFDNIHIGQTRYAKLNDSKPTNSTLACIADVGECSEERISEDALDKITRLFS